MEAGLAVQYVGGVGSPEPRWPAAHVFVPHADWDTRASTPLPCHKWGEEYEDQATGREAPMHVNSST